MGIIAGNYFCFLRLWRNNYIGTVAYGRGFMLKQPEQRSTCTNKCIPVFDHISL